jgi:taurine dioxygenase
MPILPQGGQAAPINLRHVALARTDCGDRRHKPSAITARYDDRGEFDLLPSERSPMVTPEGSEETAAMAFTARNCTPSTGSEIIGIDLSKPVSAEDRAALNRILADRGMIVFHDQKLDAPGFQKAGELFGEIMPQLVTRFTLPDHPLVGFVSSEDTDKPGGKRIVRGEQYHTDHSNTPAPPAYTSLCAVTIPKTGGDTQFVNVLNAYDDLPEETRRRIDGLKVLHVFKASRSPRQKPVLTEEEKKRIPETVQPLVLKHPVSGRKGLYLNTAHMERIIGMDDAEAFPLIDSLMQHVTQAKYEYRHKWRDGDMVIWDNRTVLHQANGDYDPSEKRFLYRVLVKGVPLQSAA